MPRRPVPRSTARTRSHRTAKSESRAQARRRAEDCARGTAESDSRSFAVPCGAPSYSSHGTLPASVHPVPLLGVPQDQTLQRRIVRPRVAPDFLADVCASDGDERFLEAQYVPSVRFAPARGGKHVRVRRERDQPQALQGPPPMAQTPHPPPPRPPPLLLQREHH